MPAPFLNAIRGTTAGTPGTGAFTPNAASTGFRPWSSVPVGWIGLVRFEDGSAWELSYCYWNGTTLSRGTNQRFDSSTGSVLSLSASSTATLVNDHWDVMFHLCGPWRAVAPDVNASTITAVGFPTRTTTGTAAAAALAATNYRSEQPRIRIGSATTAHAQAGWSWASVMMVCSTTAGRGGGEISGRFGAQQLPTNPRLFMGWTSVTNVGSTGEPSALVASIAAFTKDSTDANIQLLTNDNSGGGNKIDTGIAWVVDGWYEFSIIVEPGNVRVWAMLVRLDTGAIWLGSTTTQLPANGALMLPHMIGGLSATTGTALNLEIGTLSIINGI